MYNHAVRPAVAKSTNKIQRGFTPGRQLIENVVDLDAHARVFGKNQHQLLMPVLAAWDYAAAFPSLSHEWIKEVRIESGTPAGLRALIDGMYFLNSVVIMTADGLLVAYWVTAGVLTG